MSTVIPNCRTCNKPLNTPTSRLDYPADKDRCGCQYVTHHSGSVDTESMSEIMQEHFKSCPVCKLSVK